MLAEIRPREEPRQPTGVEEFDRVLGGGLVAGGVVLIGGDPGIGKSTLLLQALARLAQTGENVLYVSGEESGEQVALRARRLQLDVGRMQLLAEINLEKILTTLVSLRPAVAVIDSIQTVWSDAMQSAPGSVAQVRECAAQLTRFAKQSGTCVILVGHVTKEGSLAGPRVLEHMVDTVLYFEGDTHSSFRLVRAVKNRFGAVNELGVFAMTEKGLRGVSNPSALFLSQHSLDVAGSCVLCTQEGIVCGDQDVFVNAVGGVKIAEPAADLAVLLAIVSSLRNKPLPGKLVVFGEVGLAGEIRPAPRGQERLKEAAKLGFTHAIVPKANAPRAAIKGLEVIALDRVEQAIEQMRAW
jgi:DNA repair protein RadA/Sms